MLSDLIDITVDLYNTFGSLLASLALRLKNYRRQLSTVSPLSQDKADEIISMFPDITMEASVVKPSFIVIDQFSINNNIMAARIIMLNNEFKYMHFFYVRQSWNSIWRVVNVPVYWKYNQ